MLTIAGKLHAFSNPEELFVLILFSSLHKVTILDDFNNGYRKKKRTKIPGETDILLSFIFLKHFLIGRFYFFRIVQLNLTAYLESVVNAEIVY